jgi:hypothetical protein
MNKLETKYRNIYRFLIFSTLMIFIFTLSSSPALADDINLDETKTIDMYGWWEIQLSEINAGDILNVDIQVTSGGPVDILLMDATDYVNYLQDIDLEVYEDGSTDQVKSKKYSFTFDKTGDYYLVIDNDDIYGLADSIGAVDAHLKLTISTPTPTSTPTLTPTPTPTPTKSPGFEMLLVVCAFCLVIVLRRR